MYNSTYRKDEERVEESNPYLRTVPVGLLITAKEIPLKESLTNVGEGQDSENQSDVKE